MGFNFHYKWDILANSRSSRSFNNLENSSKSSSQYDDIFALESRHIFCPLFVFITKSYLAKMLKDQNENEKQKQKAPFPKNLISSTEWHLHFYCNVVEGQS